MSVNATSETKKWYLNWRSAREEGTGEHICEPSPKIVWEAQAEIQNITS